jgi:hypothetical protein
VVAAGDGIISHSDFAETMRAWISQRATREILGRCAPQDDGEKRYPQPAITTITWRIEREEFIES